MDIMETQYKDVQGKENEEDVVKLIETVVEGYVKDPKTENVKDKNDKDLEVIKKMSTIELLDIMAESEKEENSSNRSKEKRDIAAKIHMLFSKRVRRKSVRPSIMIVEKCTKEINWE